VPEMSGTVRCVRVSDFSAFTTIEDTTGDRETFILWFNPGAQIPSQLTSFTRVLHSMWLSMLREAQTNNLIVTIVHPTNSAEVTAIQVGGFP
jgi:hypothetical protein